MTEGLDRSVQMLATALEKEQRGRDMYKKAEAQCTNTLGKEILHMLMVQEGVHITRIKSIYNSIQEGKPWPEDWKSQKQENENLEELFRARARDFGQKVSADTSDLQALEMGLEFEQGAIDFFEKELSAATDPKEREFIEHMVLEERSHYASLADMKLYLSDPEAWYQEIERSGLDGA